MVNNNSFFKPTALYKEFMILDLIEKNPDITQRSIGQVLNIAVSMVNNYLDEYEKKGYLKRDYFSTKTVKYNITKKGIERKKVLNIGYLNSTQTLYDSAKDNIISFLNQIVKKGFKKILLYGAGEVAEIILHVINSNQDIPLSVVAVIDDDLEKNNIAQLKIIRLNEYQEYLHDGIFISSYTHHDTIKQKLMDVHYPKNKIIEFFNEGDL